MAGLKAAVTADLSDCLVVDSMVALWVVSMVESMAGRKVMSLAE